MEITKEDSVTNETVPVVPSVPIETVIQTPVLSAVVHTVPIYKNKQLMIAVLIAAVVLLGAGYYAYMQSTRGDVVAIVNGKKIYQKEFNESVALIEQAATQQGIDLTKEGASEEIRTQALNTLIDNTLILSASKNAGFTADDTVIQQKYDELVTQLGGADELNIRMAAVGLTEEKLRSNIAERVLADQYIESVTPIKDITVSEEEIAQFLESLKANNVELPPLEEIRPQIDAEIRTQKRQKLIADLLAKLRSEGTIEMKI